MAVESMDRCAKRAQRERLANLALGFALVGSLAACGGGEDTSADPPAAPAPAPATSQATSKSALQTLTDVGPANYPAGTVQRGAWDVMQGERVACGFGAIKQDVRLDAANTNHQEYLTHKSLATGQSWTGYYETAGDVASAYFTGVNVGDRIHHVGLPALAWGMEILTGSYASPSKGAPDQIVLDSNRGASNIRELMTTVYHLKGAMVEGKLAGIGYSHLRDTDITSPASDFEVYRYGTQVMSLNGADLQRLGTNVVATYPCAAAQQVQGNFQPAWERPNPFPEITSNTINYGTPIYFKVDYTSTLTVTSLALIQVSDGTTIATRNLTAATDPARMLGKHEFFAVPTSALTVGQSYRVVAAGTVDGHAWLKDYIFTVSF
ncbi:hypothetical protein EV685_1709 [Sphaerotilus mobilis]|uniref:Uncharacterized protein n=2 Tax=Sphaerotilus mobilis TaxID=47994 RepID=A0A4Q7LRW6_9BURK|nr:hypothetical protein EV685_1709 [Sphaerotilus mobilis]